LGLPRIESLHVIFDDLTSHYVETQEELRRDQTGLFLRFIDRIETTDVIIEPLVEESPNPAQTILRLAAEHHTDLLVMNTRGRSCAAAILLGSITTQVMIETPIAILVVKHFGAMLSLFQTLREGQFLNRSNPKTN
ncbi:MAG TPA: universal stress protein, partial [Pirellulaceae bacterium]|nr:universal stress protein [Pirellulaceae bacterium]